MPENCAIELCGVVKQYAVGEGVFTALNAVHIQVRPGEFIGVVGKSGSGKSTLINMITGIDNPTAGDIRILGTNIQALSEAKMATWRGRHIGLIFQFFQLLPTLTVLENVMMPMAFCQVYRRQERSQRALALLERLGVADQAGKRPLMLSGGQQQRVAIARALANDPPLLVADEPTGNLDEKTGDSVFAFFHELVTAGKTILMVTHDKELAANIPRVIELVDGKIVRDTRQKNRTWQAEAIHV